MVKTLRLDCRGREFRLWSGKFPHAARCGQRQKTTTKQKNASYYELNVCVSPPSPPNSYIEALTPSVAIFGVRKYRSWTSLVSQLLRIRLPMQGTRVGALVREYPTCRGATKPVRPGATTTEAHVPRVPALQQEKPPQ